MVTETRADGGRTVYYEDYTDTLQPQTVRTYNDAAHTTPVTNTYTYDSSGNVLTNTDPLGIQSEYTYQSGDQLADGAEGIRWGDPIEPRSVYLR